MHHLMAVSVFSVGFCLFAMKINIVCAGNIKDKFYSDACGEYLKRLQRFADVSITETVEFTAYKNPSQKQIDDILSREGEELIKNIKGYTAVLDIQGRKMSSEEFSKHITDIKSGGVSEITFVIGSSYGLSPKIKDSADIKISFSDMTFPHRLFRVMLLEQIYRAFMIESNSKYHK